MTGTGVVGLVVVARGVAVVSQARLLRSKGVFHGAAPVVLRGSVALLGTGVASRAQLGSWLVCGIRGLVIRLWHGLLQSAQPACCNSAVLHSYQLQLQGDMHDNQDSLKKAGLGGM